MYENKQYVGMLTPRKNGWLPGNGKVLRKVYVIIYNNEVVFFCPKLATGGLWKAIWMKCYADVEEIYRIDQGYTKDDGIIFVNMFFFIYNLRMEKDAVLILTWLSD